MSDKKVEALKALREWMEEMLENETSGSESAPAPGLCPQTRYRLQYGEHEISFSAPMAETREQLAEILEDIVGMLKAPEDTGEIGFF